MSFGIPQTYPFSGGPIVTTPFDINIQLSYPGLEFSGQEVSGGYDEIREINGALWLVTNAQFNKVTLVWNQVNVAAASYALVLQPNGTIQRFQAAAVGTGTLPPITFTAVPFVLGSSAPSQPSGRLTLTSSTPIMIADVVNASALYWTPYRGNTVPIFDGSSIWTVLASAELTCVLAAAHAVATNVYDVFLFSNNGVLTIGIGPAWATQTTRGAGAGTTQIQQQNGIWLNTNAITLWNNITSFNVGALQATYVGSIYCSGNAQVTMSFKPAPVAGGTSNQLALYNAYNRVITRSMNRDGTGGSTAYATAAWRALNNSAQERVTFLDGLQQSSLEATLKMVVGNTANNVSPSIGVNLDSTVAAPLSQGYAFLSSVAGTGEVDTTITTVETFAPQLGLHFVIAMQFSSVGSCLYYTSSGQTEALILQLEM